MKQSRFHVDTVTEMTTSAVVISIPVNVPEKSRATLIPAAAALEHLR